MIRAKILCHAPVLVCGNPYVVLTTLTSVLGKGEGKRVQTPFAKYRGQCGQQMFVVSLCVRLRNLTSLLGKGCLHIAIGNIIGYS